MPTHLLLADDHPMVRQGLRVLLELAGMVVLGEAADVLEGLAAAAVRKPTVAQYTRYTLYLPLPQGQ